jgi:hypothetical protein
LARLAQVLEQAGFSDQRPIGVPPQTAIQDRGDMVLGQERQEGFPGGGTAGRQPLTDRGGDLDPMRAFDDLQVDHVRAVQDGQVHGLAAFVRQVLEVRPGPSLQVDVLQHQRGHLDEAQPEVVLPSRLVPVDEAAAFQRRQQPMHGALVDLDALGDLRQREIGLLMREARQDVQGPLHRTHGLRQGMTSAQTVGTLVVSPDEIEFRI